jgi:N-acetylglucosaminyldiphosphoundecaprenol N-acetyl-beta-D-mannosaminyltransferase
VTRILRNDRRVSGGGCRGRDAGRFGRVDRTRVIGGRGWTLADFHRDIHCILGLPFDALTVSGVVQRLLEAAAQRTRCFLSTPNLNFLVGCQRDPRFRDSVIHSDLSIADGMPMVWIARLLDIPIRERVAGSTLFERLRKGGARQLAVYFFGGGSGAAAAACRRLRAEAGGLTCVGYDAPGYGAIEEMSGDATIRRINESGADFLVVALGAKKGQAWIERNLDRIEVPIISHLGAVLNFTAGIVERAPRWMQVTGLEWLWRIKEEPALWRRYVWDGSALLALIATRVLPYAWYLRCHRPNAGALASASADLGDDGSQCAITLRGAWTRENIGPLRDCLSAAASRGRDVRLELAEVTYVDSAFVALVMLLHAHQTQSRRRLTVVSASAPVRRVIRYCCAEDMFPCAA